MTAFVLDRSVAAAWLIEDAPPARLVELLPIEVDPETDERALGTILSLAREETPATCDAACLELAMRRGMELATLDGEPRRTARRARVAVPPR